MQLQPLKAYHKHLESRYFQPLPLTTRQKEVNIEDNFREIQEQVKGIIEGIAT
jgi:hypothetical protein